MKGKHKCEILIPFGEGQKVGDVMYIRIPDAVHGQKLGVLKIIYDEQPVIKKKEYNTPSIKKEFIINLQPKSDELNSEKIVSNIINRFKTIEKTYIEIFSASENKRDKGKDVRTESILISKETPISKIIDVADAHQFGTRGVFFNINPLKSERRNADNVTRILNAFIDLDGADVEHNNIIINALKNKGLTYYYNAKSGHGYHFLVPVNLEATKENSLKIKAFLYELKQICDKVDLNVFTIERLMRFPNSTHNKDDTPFNLLSLHTHTPNDDEIHINSEYILNCNNISEKNNVLDEQYLISIEKDDIFFSKILTASNEWKEYKTYFNKANNRNNVLIKNLGIYCQLNPDKILLGEHLVNALDTLRIGAFKGWMTKAKDTNMKVNYYELAKWAKEQNFKSFIQILEEQIKKTFLDEYELYFLEDEKKENSYLLYYPLKNYYIQKTEIEAYTIIYLDCLEKGIELDKEFSMQQINKDWDKLSFTSREDKIIKAIENVIKKEKRIKKLFNINYEPSDNKFIIKDNKKYFNTYVKSNYWDYFEKKENYNFPHIKDLLMNLVSNEEESYIYINKWLAHIIQKPLIKLPTALIFQGEHGTGKGTFKTHILDNIFSSNVKEINQTQLESSFNHWLLGRQIIVANEVMHNDNKATLPNILKNIITDQEIMISRKFKNEISCKNYSHWIFTSNNENPIKIEEGDRRYSVFYSTKLRGGGKKASEFVQELEKNLDFELKEYISYLKSLKVEFWEVHEPIMTEAKLNILDLNKNTVDKFKEHLNTYNSLKNVFEVYNKENITYCTLTNSLGEETINTELVYLLYLAYCRRFNEKGIFNKNSFTRKLKINSEPVYNDTTKVSVRTYKIKDLISSCEDCQKVII